MSGQHEEAQHLGIIFGNDIPHREKVSSGFAHLPVIDVQESVVHPVMGEGLSVRRLGLGDFVFMVRENQILSARMDVDFVSQIFFAHHGAFDVPAGTAVAPGRLPVGLPFLLGLPEHKVQRILLLILAGHQKGTLSALQIVQVLVGQLSIITEASHTVIHRSVVRHISVAVVDQLLDHLQHAADLLSGLGMHCGGAHVQGFHILFAFRDVALGNHVGVHAFLDGLLDDFVVHIGEVADIIHFIPPVFKIAAHRIEHDHGAGVADVDQVVYGGAAYIHFYLARGDGDKFFLFLCESIVNLHFVCFSFSSALLRYRTCASRSSSLFTSSEFSFCSAEISSRTGSGRCT